MHCNHIEKLTEEKRSLQADRDIRNIKKVLCLVFTFMLVEIWGHWTSNTLSLLADSIHLLVDVLGFVVSLAALKWTKKQPNSLMNFGYGRVEILGAIFSIFLIWTAVLYLIVESIHKYKYPHVINEKIFVLISIIGFVVNCVCVFFLHFSQESHKHEHKNLNIRAVYVHVIGDLIQSIGVLVAGTITYFYPKFVLADIICTVLFSILVLFSTSIIIKDGLIILSERTPKNFNREEILEKILKIENIVNVLDLKIWSISANELAINLTILIEDVYFSDYEEILKNTKSLLKDVYSAKFINVQIETHRTSINFQLLESAKQLNTI